MNFELKKIEKGFTLIEILIAVILLGIAIAAIVGSNAAFTQQTSQAGQLSTAEFLIEQIRERTALMPVDDPNQADILRFDDGSPFTPPRDSQGNQLTNFSAYTQVVTVNYVKATNFQEISTVATDFVRITVKILYNGAEISQAKWIRCKIE